MHCRKPQTGPSFPPFHSLTHCTYTPCQIDSCILEKQKTKTKKKKKLYFFPAASALGLGGGRLLAFLGPRKSGAPGVRYVGFWS